MGVMGLFPGRLIHCVTQSSPSVTLEGGELACCAFLFPQWQCVRVCVHVSFQTQRNVTLPDQLCRVPGGVAAVRRGAATIPCVTLYCL